MKHLTVAIVEALKNLLDSRYTTYQRTLHTKALSCSIAGYVISTMGGGIVPIMKKRFGDFEVGV